MTEPLDLLTKKLKEKGYSLTRPRKVTFDVLSESKQPLTMQDVIRRTNKLIDRASVYRSIDVFEETGVTERLYSGWKYKIELSDVFQEHHHHFTCTNCGKVIPMNSTEIEKIINELSMANNFQTTNHQLEIQGVCSQCQ